MWTPTEVRKTIGLICGLGFITWGAIMMVEKITANGTFEIKSSLLEGKLESGSAGLFLIFVGLFIVIFSMLNSNRDESKKDFIKNNKVILAICILLFFIITMLLYVFFPNNSILITFACSALLFPFVMLVRAIIQE